MTDRIQEAVALPVNELGEVVVSPGIGTTNVVANLALGRFPIDTEDRGLSLRLPDVLVGADMRKEVYDPNDDGKIDYAQTTGLEPTLEKGDLLGTTNQINVSGDNLDSVIGSGITLSLPQDLHQHAIPEFDGIKFDITPENTTDSPGILQYDTEAKTLGFQTGIPGVTVQIGQEHHIICRNITGGNLLSGDVVYISGNDLGYPTVSKALATSYEQGDSIIGVVTSDAANNALLMVTRLGVVNNLNTSAYAPGTVLYLSDTVAGSFIGSKPSTINRIVRIGWVRKQGLLDGQILVDVQVEMNSQGYFLDAQRRDGVYSLPTTPTAFVWDIEARDTLNAYNPATGVLTIPFTGQYTIQFAALARSKVSTQSVFSASQRYVDGVWTNNEFTCRQDSAKNGENKQTLFVSSSEFEAGTQLRFLVWCSSSVDFITYSPAAGLTIPACRLLISGVKTV